MIQQHFGATIHKFKKQSSPNNKISFTFLLIIEYHKTLCQPINFPCKHYNASLLSIFHFSFFILHKKNSENTKKNTPHFLQSVLSFTIYILNVFLIFHPPIFFLRLSVLYIYMFSSLNALFFMSDTNQMIRICYYIKKKIELKQ